MSSVQMGVLRASVWGLWMENVTVGKGFGTQGQASQFLTGWEMVYEMGCEKKQVCCTQLGLGGEQILFPLPSKCGNKAGHSHLLKGQKEFPRDHWALSDFRNLWDFIFGERSASLPIHVDLYVSLNLKMYSTVDELRSWYLYQWWEESVLRMWIEVACVMSQCKGQKGIQCPRSCNYKSWIVSAPEGSHSTLIFFSPSFPPSSSSSSFPFFLLFLFSLLQNWQSSFYWKT